MRLSIRPNDPGYQLYRAGRAQGARPSIKFNGEPALGIVTADSDCGMMVRLQRNGDDYVYCPDRRELLDEVVHGRVEIEWVEEMML